MIVSETTPAIVSYRLSDMRSTAARWGGVIERAVAKDLVPWARAVVLDFDAFRVGRGVWEEVRAGQRLRGCLLRGEGLDTVVFAVVEAGWPVVTGVRRTGH